MLFGAAISVKGITNITIFDLFTAFTPHAELLKFKILFQNSRVILDP